MLNYSIKLQLKHLSLQTTFVTIQLPSLILMLLVTWVLGLNNNTLRDSGMRKMIQSATKLIILIFSLLAISLSTMVVRMPALAQKAVSPEKDTVLMLLVNVLSHFPQLEDFQSTLTIRLLILITVRTQLSTHAAHTTNCGSLLDKLWFLMFSTTRCSILLK